MTLVEGEVYFERKAEAPQNEERGDAGTTAAVPGAARFSMLAMIAPYGLAGQARRRGKMGTAPNLAPRFAGYGQGVAAPLPTFPDRVEQSAKNGNQK
jgi:hypothetical protein